MGRVEAMRRRLPFTKLEEIEEAVRIKREEGESVPRQALASSHTFRCCHYQSLTGFFCKTAGFAGGYLLCFIKNALG